MGNTRTVGFLALGRRTLSDGAGLFQVDVPALGLSGRVLQCESEDGFALLNGIFLVGFVCGER